MIGLFSFDGPMYRDCNGVYCNTTITSEMLARYFEVVDELIVVIRVCSLPETYTEAGLHKVEVENIEFIELPTFNSIKGFFVDRLRYKSVIKRHVERTDLIFARIPSVTSDLVLKIARVNKKKYLVEVGGCAWDAFWNHSMLGKIIAPLMYIRERESVKYASYSTYVTSEWLQKRYPTRGLSTIASNVYLMPHSKSVINARIKKIKTYTRGSRIVIGTAAAVNVRYKGQASIMKAMSYLIKEGYDLYYEMIGVGDFESLRKTAMKYNLGSRVIHRGILPKSEVYAWLDEIDIYAQPSKQEGLPRALVEAMSRGLPSFGSNVAGIPEILPCEVIFKKGDNNDICKVFRNLIESNLESHAVKNFENSKGFELSRLKKRRSDIFNLYKNEIIGQD